MQKMTGSNSYLITEARKQHATLGIVSAFLALYRFPFRMS
jgi:hypothetical protein